MNRADPTGMVVTYVTPDGRYTDDFNDYAQAFNNRGGGAFSRNSTNSAPSRLSYTELKPACETGQYWFAPGWNDCTGTEGELFGAYASWFVPLPMGGLSRVFMKEAGLTAQEAISAFKKGSIMREFPTQYLGSTLEELEKAKRMGDWDAFKAIKLLFQKGFDK